MVLAAHLGAQVESACSPRGLRGPGREPTSDSGAGRQTAAASAGRSTEC